MGEITKRVERAFGPSVTTGNFIRTVGAAIALSVAAALPAQAQDAVAGAATWTSKCSGCHGAVAGPRANASDAPGVISAAIANTAVTGMGGVATTATERSNLGAYIESIFNTSPIAATATCNSPTTIFISGDIAMSTSATGFNVLETLTPPSHGTTSYDTVLERITYTPAANNTTDVSFTYRARNSGTGLVSSTRLVQVAINKDSNSITFPAVVTQTYNPGGTFSLSASATSGLTVSYSSSTPSVCTVAGSLVTEQGAGTCTITASQAGNGCYNGAFNVVQDITILKSNQTITFTQPVAQTFNPGGTFSVSGSASSGLAVTFTSTTPSVCTVAGTLVTEQGAGTCTLNANQAGNTNYNAAPQVSRSVTIGKANQTITFPAQTTVTQPYTLNGTFAVAPNASASSGLIVTYGSSTPTICSVTGNSSIGGTVTKLAAGVCTITANQAGNTSYNAAPQQVQSVTITPTIPGAPTIGVGTAGDTSATIAYTLNANTGGQVITSTIATCSAAGQTTRTGTDAVAPFTAITVTGLVNNVTYSCSVQAANATGPSVASGTVGVMPSQTPTPPVITSAPSTAFTVGSFGSFQVTASGFPAPTFSFTGTLPSGVTLTAAGLLSGTPALGTVANYSITITASNGNLPQGTQSFQLAVQKANQTISFTPPATQLFSAATVPLAATATSGLAVTYASQSPAVCTVTGAVVNKISVGTCVIAADQAGNANFNAAPQVVQQFDIDMGPQTITFNPQSPVSRSFAPAGTFPLSPAASASSGLPVSYQSLTVDVCTISGTTPTVTIVAVGLCTIEAFHLGNANYDAAAPVQRSVGIVKADQTITFPVQPQQNFATGGTFAVNPLATTTSGLPITYNSTTIATCTVSGTTVTIVAVGTCTIAANQAGDSNWNAAPQVTRSLQIQAVVPGAPTIGVATPGNGQATIEFTPPGFNGGATINNYTATCQPNNFTGNATASPVTVSGLANNTTYSCTVTANNSVGSSLPSSAVDVTPVAIDGAALWGSVCISCHGPTPAATRLNGGGTTSAVIEFVRANQPSMVLTPQVQALSPADLSAIAAFIAANTPPVNVTTAPNTPKTVSAANNLTIGTISFTEMEIVTPPLSGSLSVVNGTEVVYTPNNGFTGVDTFTYRGKRTDPLLLQGDPRTATINVLNGAPLLTVAKAGNGQGSVTGLLPGDGINCGSDCTEAYATGQVVSLVATASPGSVFTGWSNGDCTGTFACDVTMDTAKSVTANFALQTFTLTVQRFGSGTVTSNPAGINCGATCAADFNSGSTVTLTAVPLTGFQFDGWTGAGCSGTGTCPVTMSAAQSVTAIFSVAPVSSFALTVTKSGAGGGVVSSTPGGIDCGATCAANFNSGVSVALGAAPSADSFFNGWTGACTGTGACNVTMDAAKSVGAEFKLNASIPRLANISTRMQVLTGNDVLIGGFIIGGSASKTVVVRARGPSLIPFGITNALANPTMQLFSGQNVLETSDDWGTAANAADITASGFAPSSPLESAILTTLSPGAYTAVVSGVGGTSGVGIIEVFEVDKPEIPLLNISTRGQVLTGGDVMIGGFIIQGDSPKTVTVRARGPSLVPFGITNALLDPVLQLFNGATMVAMNDDWQVQTVPGDVAAIQTSGFAPADTREAVIRITLPPGAYTAIVSGKNGTTGVGIVEAFVE